MGELCQPHTSLGQEESKACLDNAEKQGWSLIFHDVLGGFWLTFPHRVVRGNSTHHFLGQPGPHGAVREGKMAPDIPQAARPLWNREGRGNGSHHSLRQPGPHGAVREREMAPTIPSDSQALMEL